MMAGVGERMGWRWELLGVDMGWVPEPMHKVLPWLPPVWSDVRMDRRDHFYATDDLLHGARSHALFRHDEDDGWVVIDVAE